MKVVKTVKEVREIVAEWRKEGLSVGLVPTMGFLHEGHQSLEPDSQVGQSERPHGGFSICKPHPVWSQ